MKLVPLAALASVWAGRTALRGLLKGYLRQSWAGGPPAANCETGIRSRKPAAALAARRSGLVPTIHTIDAFSWNNTKLLQYKLKPSIHSQGILQSGVQVSSDDLCALIGRKVWLVSRELTKSKEQRWVAVISGKNHKRQRRKRQSVTAKRGKSQTPKFLTAILT